MKDFLRDNETLSEFLEQNATLSKHSVEQIVDANINLEKVRVDYKHLGFTRLSARFCSLTLTYQNIFQAQACVNIIRRYEEFYILNSEPWGCLLILLYIHDRSVTQGQRVRQISCNSLN